MKKIAYIGLIVAGMIGMQSCSSSREVKRIATDQTVDLSGRWNDSDSRLAAEELINKILSERWLTDFEQTHAGQRPALVVGLVYNKSHEHIEAETFVKDLEKACIKSGRIRLVQAGEKREALRGERADQQEFASKNTAKKWGQELGADFMLQGSINSILDQYKNEKIVYYQIDLELSHLETNEIVWIGDKKIKKYVTN